MSKVNKAAWEMAARYGGILEATADGGCLGCWYVCRWAVMYEKRPGISRSLCIIWI